MRREQKFSIVAVIIGIVIISQCLLYKTNAATVEENVLENVSGLMSYNNYLADNPSYPKDVIVLKSTDAKSVTDGATLREIDKISNALCFEKNSSAAEWTFDVIDEGYYNISIAYCNLPLKASDIEFALLINGEIPFEKASSIRIPRQYKDLNSITRDDRGNDIRPAKTEVFSWRTTFLKDKEGIYDALGFKLKKGVNTIKIITVKAGFAVDSLTFSNPEKTIDYATYRSNNSDRSGNKNNSIGNNGRNDNAESTVTNINTNSSTSNDENSVDISKTYFNKIQGENSNTTSHTTLYPTYDRMSSITELSDGSPNDPVKLRLNTIGQGNWKMPGMYITWKIDVPQDGYYEIGLRARQNIVRGFFSSRNIYIDDQIPFSELQNYKFNYNPDWSVIELGDTNPYEFYLTKGQHIIKMEVTAGVIGKTVGEFENIIYELNNLYRQIIMITGVNPDPYRDYNLYDEVPEFNKRLEQLIGRINTARNSMLELGINKGSNAVAAETVAIQLQSFIDKPRTVPTRINSFQNNISSLSGFMLALKEQPLEIDYLFIKGSEAALPVENSNFLQTVLFRMQSFMSSFSEDYSLISNAMAEKSNISVWVGSGRDQAQIVKDLTESFFTPKEKTVVNLSLVQQGLVEAIAAGKGPDVMLFSDNVSPVNLAARNALCDLSRLDGFDLAKKRYIEGAFVPFEYNGGVYGLPLQQAFPMLFYRKDIFKELDLTPPKTWNEFYFVVSKLQKNRLQIGMPVGKVTAPDNSMFDILLYQNAGSFYNSDFSKTNLDSEEALTAFKQWTELYTKYSLPLEFDFYTRFRSGEMPMSVQNYTMYNLLSVSAPEIMGLWEMIPLPGTARKDGTIDNTAVCGGTSAIMLSKTKDKNAAFKFMLWFTSAEIQTEYGLAVENILGQGGRYDPANKEALENMNWTDSELKKIKTQFEKGKFTPVIPSTYIITRNLTNAFRAVVINGEKPRETIYSYNLDINEEIHKKRVELGLEK